MKLLLGVAGVLLAVIGSGVADAYVIIGGNPGKWGPTTFGTGAAITWSIMGAGLDTDGAQTVDPDALLPSGYHSEIVDAFSLWAAVADLSFSQAMDPNVGWLNNTADTVDIRIGFRYSDGPGGNLGFGYYPLFSNGAGAGDIFLDSADIWNLDSGARFSLRRTLVHEVGHAIGLGHSFSGTAMYPYYSDGWEEPQPDDIAGAQYIYGAPAVVPTPATLPMLLGGLALLVLVRRTS